MQNKQVPEGAEIHRHDYASLDEFVSAFTDEEISAHARGNEEFTGVKNVQQAKDLGKNGWAAELPNALSVAESAIAKVEKEHEMPVFTPVFDVAGADVDMGRYMSGEPECMVDYPLSMTVKAGRVITLCASMSISGAVNASSIIKRGHAVVALALALSQLGYQIEIYSDLTGDAHGPYSVTRVLVKSAHDVFDAERIMFALAHPAMLRVFAFASLLSFPSESGCRTTWQTPVDPIHDLPEGTLYLPSVISDHDVPDADVALTGYLRELELITD